MALLLQRLLSFFPLLKQKDLNYISVEDAKIGQMVEVKFHDPRTLGLHVPGHTTCTRFNPDEFENRTIHGFVKHVGQWLGGPNFGSYITIKTVKHQDDREFLLLKHEVESIRILD